MEWNGTVRCYYLSGAWRQEGGPSGAAGRIGPMAGRAGADRRAVVAVSRGGRVRSCLLRVRHMRAGARLLAGPARPARPHRLGLPCRAVSRVDVRPESDRAVRATETRLPQLSQNYHSLVGE
jgi:hypothetical protein